MFHNLWYSARTVSQFVGVLLGVEWITRVCFSARNFDTVFLFRIMINHHHFWRVCQTSSMTQGCNESNVAKLGQKLAFSSSTRVASEASISTSIWASFRSLSCEVMASMASRPLVESRVDLWLEQGTSEVLPSSDETVETDCIDTMERRGFTRTGRRIVLKRTLKCWNLTNTCPKWKETSNNFAIV